MAVAVWVRRAVTLVLVSAFALMLYQMSAYRLSEPRYGVPPPLLGEDGRQHRFKTEQEAIEASRLAAMTTVRPPGETVDAHEPAHVGDPAWPPRQAQQPQQQAAPRTTEVAATTTAPARSQTLQAAAAVTPFGTLPPEPQELDAFVARRLQWDDATRRQDATAAKGLVVYECSSGFCGGLGDRLYGIITCFFLAALTDRLFMVNMRQPVPLEKYMVPGPTSTDWRFNADVDSALRTKTGGGGQFRFIDTYPQSVVEGQDWRVGATPGHITCAGNLILANPMYRNPILRELFVQGGVHSATPHMFARAAIRQLFAPSPQLQAELDAFWAQYPKADYVSLGIQIRSGDKTTWYDPKRLDASSIKCFVDKAIDMLPPVARAAGKKPLIFVATDSDEFATLLKQQLLSRDATLVVVTDDKYRRSHVDRPNGGTDFGAYARTFVDYFLLAGMDMRLLSRSNFAYVASLIAPTGLGDLFYKDENAPPCTFIPFSIDRIANQ